MAFVHSRSAVLHSVIREAALEYAARGWSVVPIERHGKRPLIPWLEFQSRVATPDEIGRWFRSWPDANIGIVTGLLSGLVVLDIDPRHGGTDSLSRIEGEHGPLPSTIEAVTGGGGRHLYFVHPGGAPIANRVGLRPGIDLRGDGGCVVAPPSVHARGTRYAWTPARAPHRASAAPLPGWVAREPAHGRTGRPTAYWRRLVREGITEGERNATLASLTGHLLWHGVDREVALELMLAWNRARCRPPIDSAEVARVVDSIARMHAGERIRSVH
jgi:hypothetical protein